LSGLIERKLHEILRDQKHGAAFLAREALNLIRLAAHESRAVEAGAFLKELATLGCRLISLRPSMSSPIANAVVRVFNGISRVAETTYDATAIREATDRIIEDLVAASRQNVNRAAERACQLVPERATILTHSYSETCLRALLACKPKSPRVYATESRPLFEGRKTVVALREAGIDVTLLTDVQAGHFIAKADLVLVGADTVLPDGSVVNKIGTYLIALAANDKGAPFHVVCDTWKFRIESGVFQLEEKSPGEVVADSERIPARNVYFDITPSRLVTSLLTEEGQISPSEVAAKNEKWRGALERMRLVGSLPCA
jgi:translation initiation factor 2B subunit (eIF-2B alpha/beta/delta family)